MQSIEIETTTENQKIISNNRERLISYYYDWQAYGGHRVLMYSRYHRWDWSECMLKCPFILVWDLLQLSSATEMHKLPWSRKLSNRWGRTHNIHDTQDAAGCRSMAWHFFSPGIYMGAAWHATLTKRPQPTKYTPSWPQHSPLAVTSKHCNMPCNVTKPVQEWPEEHDRELKASTKFPGSQSGRASVGGARSMEALERWSVVSGTRVLATALFWVQGGVSLT